jgi:hypothetical protein
MESRRSESSLFSFRVIDDGWWRLDLTTALGRWSLRGLPLPAEFPRRHSSVAEAVSASRAGWLATQTGEIVPYPDGGVDRR